MKRSDNSSEISRISKTEMRKSKKKILFTEQETEAASQLIHLNTCHHITCPVTHTTNSHVNEPSMNIVPESEKFLRVPEIDDNVGDEGSNHSINTCDIRKRKCDGIGSCRSSVTFDFDDNHAGEAVNYVKKIKKFRSIADLYNVTKPM